MLPRNEARFQRSNSNWLASWGVAPGWYKSAPLALSRYGLPARRKGETSGCQAGVGFSANAPCHSAGQVAQRHGLVARSTHFSDRP